MNSVPFKNIYIWPSYRKNLGGMSMYLHIFFMNNSAILANVDKSLHGTSEDCYLFIQHKKSWPYLTGNIMKGHIISRKTLNWKKYDRIFENSHHFPVIFKQKIYGSGKMTEFLKKLRIFERPGKWVWSLNSTEKLAHLKYFLKISCLYSILITKIVFY